MTRAWMLAALAWTAGVGVEALAGCSGGGPVTAAPASAPATASEGSPLPGRPEQAQAQLRNGRRIFRYDTFGDETFWGGVLRLHQAIEGGAHGGTGSGVSPRQALAVGLKVDVDALDRPTLQALRAGTVDLDSPDTTLALLSQGAVVGVKAVPDGKGGLASLGISCALCHSTVDDALAAGIGHRLDGWPNQDLDVGAVVGLSPDLTPVAQLLGTDQPTVRAALAGWGPGKFDAELFLDGKAFQPDGRSAATVIPPAYGLAGVNLHTYTGWGSIPYWNAFVAVLEMHGQGTFFDPRLDDATRFPVAARNGFGHVHADDDLVTAKLPDLQRYQLSLTAPRPPAGALDPHAVARGRDVFAGPARCASCHVPPLYTEPGWDLHTAQEIGIDDFQASRSPDGRYRTTPLRGLASHGKRGYYHDGRYATLADVVDHYDSFLGLGLSTGQKADLVQYLGSL
jgi:hypothetical protein